MGLGSTARKLQKMVDLSQELYGRVNELREQIVGVRDTVDGTNERVAALESEVSKQRAILEALAAEQGVDVEAVVEAEEDASDTSADDTDEVGEAGEAGGEAGDGGAAAPGRADGDA